MPTTLNCRFLLPVSGDEYSFMEAPWSERLSGGNCYSLAMGFYNAAATSKTQPGDVAMIYRNMQDRFGLMKPLDVKDCTELRKRILADGIAMKRILLKSKDGQPFDHLESVVRVAKMDARAPKGFYKIMTVVDAGNDFHFFRQDMMDLYNIYTCKMYFYVKDKTMALAPNPYQVLGIDPFSRNIEAMYDKDSAYPEEKKDAFQKLTGILGPIMEGQEADLNRAITNVCIHVRRLPAYVIQEGNFIVDPFWILDESDVRGDASASSRLQKKADRLFHFFSTKEKPLQASTVQQALHDCFQILRDPKMAPQKHQLIGVWSQKLGFATPAINCDANRKLISIRAGQPGGSGRTALPTARCATLSSSKRTMV